MCRPTAVGLAVAALLSSGATATARAQEVVVAPSFGIHSDGHVVTGGALGIPLGDVGGPLALIISGGVDATNDWAEPSQWEYWEINADLALYGADMAQGGLFLLAGLNLANVYEEVTGFFPAGPRSEETTVALNLGGGFGVAIRSVIPVLGAKLEIGKRKPFVVFFALGVPLGRD